MFQINSAENSKKLSGQDKNGSNNRGVFNFEQGQDNNWHKSNLSPNLDHKSRNCEGIEEEKRVLTEERK